MRPSVRTTGSSKLRRTAPSGMRPASASDPACDRQQNRHVASHGEPGTRNKLTAAPAIEMMPIVRVAGGRPSSVRHDPGWAEPSSSRNGRQSRPHSQGRQQTCGSGVECQEVAGEHRRTIAEARRGREEYRCAGRFSGPTADHGGNGDPTCRSAVIRVDAAPDLVRGRRHRTPGRTFARAVERPTTKERS